MYNEAMKEDFLYLYNEVFDEEGNIKNCGRKKCQELIEKCQEIDPGVFYGELNRGFMNIDAIRRLRKTIP